ncbi:hypothetical protein GCM10009677_00650 [Sphaerisporangium rubeum]|uniref:Uncharacterized protein n=1 Tax=Sphaerisporangium rubeum TaxID=321317 RepID=A0A7X0IHB9_9ACTN|nr:hypothetical protein [Sphaerisporangium rubeum]MBB6474953.1 hypothetical protein [Sphaerisporangium rubeum]
MSAGEGLDWLVFGWEQQDGGLGLLRSSLPAEEREFWDRQLFTLVEVQRDAGAASSPSLCRLVIDGEPVALHRHPTSDPDPRRRIRTYAYKGVPSLLGPREVLGVADSWHTRLPDAAEGPPLSPAALLTLTPAIQGALTDRVRGAEPGVTPSALSPLAAGLPRLVAEVLRDPEAMFSCRLAAGADAKVVMWGLLDLLDRVVGTTGAGYWAFSTEQSDDLAAGLPRFVFLAEWPYSAKQSRHTRVDLEQELRPGDPHDEVAARLVEAYLGDPAGVAELCRAAGLREQAPGGRQVAALLRYFRRHPYGLSATRPEHEPEQQHWDDEGDLLAPRDDEHLDVLGPVPSMAPGPDPVTEPAGQDVPPDADRSVDTTGATKAYLFRTGRPLVRPPRSRRPYARDDGEPDLLESPEPAAPPAVRHGAAPDPLGADRTYAMTVLVNALRFASDGDELRSYLRAFPVSARADPENRAVLRAAMEKYGCFTELFTRLLPEQDVEHTLKHVTMCAFHDADMAATDAFACSARLAGRQDTPSAVVTRLMELVSYTEPDRTREWMDIAAGEHARSSGPPQHGTPGFPPAPQQRPDDRQVAVPLRKESRWRLRRSSTGRKRPPQAYSNRASGVEGPWVPVFIVVVLLALLVVVILTR